MKTFLILMTVAAATAACEPKNDGGDDGDSDSGGDISTPSDCPDPNADDVSYVSQDVEFCKVVRFFCETGEPFSNECGCGCTIPEEVACGARLGDTCGDFEYCDFTEDAICGRADATGTCKTVPTMCTREYFPVCGCDDKTYSNACTANAQGVSVLHTGKCEGDDQPKGCGARLGDTCDADEYCAYEPGATCGWADAPAVCKPRPEACTMQYDPVCGCDQKTYGNSCSAANQGVGVLHEGPCDGSGGPTQQQ